MSLTASPNPIAFGSIVHGTSKDITVTLTPDVTSDSIFAVIVKGTTEVTTNETYDTPPSQGGLYNNYNNSQLITGPATFTATWAPAAASTLAGTLEIHYNGVGEAFLLSIPLTGTAT